MLNKTILQGRMVADAELKTTPSGKVVTTFAIAVERNIKSADGTRKADFINIVAWGKTAEFVSKYFGKGNLMVVEGELQTRLWEDNNGNKRKETEVIASGIYFCESKKKDDAPAYCSALPNAEEIEARTIYRS